MRKQEYIQLLITDNETSGERHAIFNDVIDCVDIALSQTPSDFEIDASIGLEKLFGAIEKAARKHAKNGCGSVGPFEAAELIAQMLGTQYQRITQKAAKNNGIIDLEEFF